MVILDCQKAVQNALRKKCMQPEKIISDTEKEKIKELFPPARSLKLSKGSGIKNKEEITWNPIEERLS